MWASAGRSQWLPAAVPLDRRALRGSHSRIMDRMTNAPDWITVASYENADGRPTPPAAVRA
ncbi:hypothetical protein ACIRJM_17770 [Streptomyces sp. NPDC102405]|uniref:hypothetical protein n=1 Tax=Streptomyces sp. NPDC102405 TaxID=3366170 RepID=UPI00382F2716